PEKVKPGGSSVLDRGRVPVMSLARRYGWEEERSESKGQQPQDRGLTGPAGAPAPCLLPLIHWPVRASETRWGSFFQPYFWANSSGLSVSWPRSVCTT